MVRQAQVLLYLLAIGIGSLCPGKVVAKEVVLSPIGNQTPVENRRDTIKGAGADASSMDALHVPSAREIIKDMTAKHEAAMQKQAEVQPGQERLLHELQVRVEEQRRNSIITLAGAFGVILFLVVMLFNLKKRTARALHQKEKELDTLNEFKNRLLDAVSHDLEKPMSEFIQLTERIVEDKHFTSTLEKKEYFTQLNQSSLDLSQHLKTLHTWALSQSGAFSFRPEVFSCMEVATRAAEQMQPARMEKKMELTYLIPDNLKAFGDAHMITIVLLNLLSNAIKFSKEGGTLVIFAGYKDRVVTMGVRDHGVGISSLDQSQLLGAKVDEGVAKNENHTGKGLVLCKELIERNGGNLYMESRLGQGSNFYFSIPK